jgi:hypothetical protein
VTVREADCDLTGVALTHDGVGVTVPAPGESATGIFDAAAGGVSRTATADRDINTGDVTFTVVSP